MSSKQDAIMQQQSQAQAARQEAQERFNIELREFQEQSTFPEHMIFPEFNKYKQKVMGFYAPSSLKMSIQEWDVLYHKKEHFNLLEMGTLLNLMEGRSMEGLKMDYDEYVKYQVEITSMAIEFANILQPKINSLKNKHQALSKIAKPNKTIAIPR